MMFSGEHTLRASRSIVLQIISLLLVIASRGGGRRRVSAVYGFGMQVGGINVHKVYLHHQNNNNSHKNNDNADDDLISSNSPYCLAVSSALDVMMNCDATDEDSSKTSTPIKKPINFLATQVWPSARVASLVLEKYLNDPRLESELSTVCEFGCGPGLPSITAAVTKNTYITKVYATDIDEFALQLVKEASEQQQKQSIMETRQIDLTMDPNLFLSSSDQNVLPEADLYLFSDVFESSAVAVGAARITDYILRTRNGAKVWVFAQTDRVQRETYLKEMQQRLNDSTLTWTKVPDPANNDEFDPQAQNLVLFNIDETLVSYG